MPDPYKDAKELGLYKEISDHKYKSVSANTIVDRILKSRALYEERQKVKGVKGLGEEAVKKREELEAKALKRRLDRTGVQADGAADDEDEGGEQ